MDLGTIFDKKNGPNPRIVKTHKYIYIFLPAYCNYPYMTVIISYCKRNISSDKINILKYICCTLFYPQKIMVVITVKLVECEIQGKITIARRKNHTLYKRNSRDTKCCRRT